MVADADAHALTLLDGSLYWLDDTSSQLRQVPIAGGTATDTLHVVSGGAMLATADGLIWSGVSSHDIRRWTKGAAQAVTLIDGLHDAPNRMALAGQDLYWSDGASCGAVFHLPASGAPEQLVAGLYDPAWVGVNGQHLYVVGLDRVYRLDL